MVVAVDTSSLVAYLGGATGKDVEVLEELFEFGSVMLPPVVLTEILSDPTLKKKVIEYLKAVPRLALKEGYFERAALTRQSLLKKKLKARLGDALIAQSCIDHDVALITRDRDFRHYKKLAGLVLI